MRYILCLMLLAMTTSGCIYNKQSGYAGVKIPVVPGIYNIDVYAGFENVQQWKEDEDDEEVSSSDPGAVHRRRLRRMHAGIDREGR